MWDPPLWFLFSADICKPYLIICCNTFYNVISLTCFPSTFHLLLSFLAFFLSQHEEKDVSHHAHPIWEDPPLLQRSCECLSLSMATHDSPSPSSPHTHTSVERSSPPLLPLALVRKSFQWAAALSSHISHKIKVIQTLYFTGRHSATRQPHSQLHQYIRKKKNVT